MSNPYSFKHIVLTIPNQENLYDGVKLLVASFRKLRSRAVWKKFVDGGAFVIEVTGSPGHWHAHIHAVVKAKYFPVFLLAKIWKTVSPGRIVWINEVGKKAVPNYLTKYLTKSSCGAENEKTVSTVLRNFRLFQPFGVWHGLSRGYERPAYPCQACGCADWIYPECDGHPRRMHHTIAPRAPTPEYSNA